MFRLDPDESPTRQLAGLLPHISLVRPAEVLLLFLGFLFVSENCADICFPFSQVKVEEESRKVPQELAEEEKQQVVASAEFQQFLGRASKLMERALTEEVRV